MILALSALALSAAAAPPTDSKAETARWMVHMIDWGVLSTISTRAMHMAPRLRDALGISAPDCEKSQPPSPAKSPVRGQTSTSSATPSMDPELLQA